MLIRNLFFLLALLMAAGLSSATDKYRLILVDDPATTAVIAWNQVSGQDALLHYGTEDFGSDAIGYPFVAAVTRAANFRGMNNRFVSLSGLQPNTNYYFVFSDQDGVSRRLWFRTAPADDSPLSFVAGGDSRNNRTPRRQANSLVAKLKPHAVLFGGDMVDEDVDQEWQEWFDDWQETISPEGRMIPIVPARGNHEMPGTIAKLFNTPEGSFYALTWGDRMMRTYTLNSEIPVGEGSNQMAWLRDDLTAQTDLRWKMAQYHKPMRPHTRRKGEGDAVYGAWSKLFYDNDVRLAVDCDSHATKVTWPIKPATGRGSDEGFVIDKDFGTVYAGEGCWGAPLKKANDGKSWTRNMGSFNQFNLIHVYYNRIELRVIRTDFAAEADSKADDAPVTDLPAGLRIWAPDGDGVVVINPRPNERILTSAEMVAAPPYPNPTSGQVFIPSGSNVRELLIYRLNGQLVRRAVVARSVDLSEEVPGIYVIKVIPFVGEVSSYRVVKR